MADPRTLGDDALPVRKSDDPGQSIRPPARARGHSSQRGPSLMVPFTLKVSDEQIEDLSRRLRHTRLPEPQTVPDWSQGVPRQIIADMCQAWLEEHDWRHLESELNAYEQWRTEIDGLRIHFLYARS